MSTQVQKIYPAMAAILGEITPIANLSLSIDEVYGKLQAVISKQKLLCMPRIIGHTHSTKPGQHQVTATTLVEIEFLFVADDDSQVRAQGVGVVTNNESHLTNAALLAAHKAALLQVFSMEVRPTGVLAPTTQAAPVSLPATTQLAQTPTLPTGPKKGEQMVGKIMSQAGEVAVTTADKINPPTKKELADASNALLEWQNKLDTLSVEEPGQWDAHRDMLKDLKLIKPQEKIELFNAMRKKGQAYGVEFDEERRMFYLADIPTLP